MKRLFLHTLVLFTALVVGSCSLDDDDANFEFDYLPIIDAEVPESFNLDQVYRINVTYLRPDECTFFQGFDVYRVDQTTREVVIVASILTNEEECAQVNQEIEASFDFLVKYSDTYLFKFWSGEDENGDPIFIEMEVPTGEAQPNN